MTFGIQRVLDSKRTYRERVAALPIGDKLRMLDTLREREVAIRHAAASNITPLSIGERRAVFAVPEE